MDTPSFYLENVLHDKDELSDFEGPLSVILMLLSKNKIEVRDIKIADILDQYLEYLDKMQEMDLEIASEFIQMASHLLYIKTKTLLTNSEEVTELEILIESLEQLKFREAFTTVSAVVPQLNEMAAQGLRYCTRPREVLKSTENEYEYSHTGVELLQALYSVYSDNGTESERAPTVPSMPERIIYSIKNKSREILDVLKSSGSQLLNTLYSCCNSESEMVATFLSVLELCSIGSVYVEKNDDGYYLSFIGGDTEKILEGITE